MRRGSLDCIDELHCLGMDENRDLQMADLIRKIYIGIMGDDPSPKENTVFLYVIIIWACQKKGSKMRDASRHDFPGPQRPLR